MLSHREEDPSLDRVDALAKLVNEICRSAAFDLAFKVGHLIIRELYEGDVAAWRTEGVTRPSYRALAARSDLILSPSGLCRAVGVYVLAQRLGGRERWPHLCVSHLKEVLPLSECEQERLLDLAEREGWTVAELRQNVCLGRAQLGRAAGSSLLRTVRRLHVQLSDQAEVLKSAARGFLQPSEVRELQSLVGLLQQQLSALHELTLANQQASSGPAE